MTELGAKQMGRGGAAHWHSLPTGSFASFQPDLLNRKSKAPPPPPAHPPTRWEKAAERVGSPDFYCGAHLPDAEGDMEDAQAVPSLGASYRSLLQGALRTSVDVRPSGSFWTQKGQLTHGQQETNASEFSSRLSLSRVASTEEPVGVSCLVLPSPGVPHETTGHRFGHRSHYLMYL